MGNFNGEDAGKIRKSTEDAKAEAKAEVKKKAGLRGMIKSAAVGFGAYYSIYVHENLEAQHKVGKAKFLEDAINEQKGILIDDLARILKK